MSEQQGRQSPDPERQTAKQVAEPASGKADAAPSESHAKTSSEETLKNLESNPKGPLEDEAAAKISKQGGSGH